jgi:hypothetical protein
MTGMFRTNAINGVANLFEIPRKVMESFVDIALSPDFPSRKAALRELLISLQMEPDMVNRSAAVVEDVLDQYKIIETNMGNLANLGHLLGMPSSFLEVLTPGTCRKLELNKAIQKEFVHKFGQEFGVMSVAVLDGVANLV